jgi:hypothetical protein
MTVRLATVAFGSVLLAMPAEEGTAAACPRWPVIHVVTLVQENHGGSMVRFARLMKRLGAVEALNLDGGGASTMGGRGTVVNGPSEGHLRHVASSALILPARIPARAESA